MIVKPAREGSTLGLTKVSTPADFDAAWKLAAKYDDLVVAEEFIDGQELTASIFTDPKRGGEVALPLVRIVAPQGNYDYQNKYFTDVTKYYVPSGLRPELEDEIRAVEDSQALADIAEANSLHVDVGRFFFGDAHAVIFYFNRKSAAEAMRAYVDSATF